MLHRARERERFCIYCVRFVDKSCVFSSVIVYICVCVCACMCVFILRGLLVLNNFIHSILFLTEFWLTILHSPTISFFLLHSHRRIHIHTDTHTLTQAYSYSHSKSLTCTVLHMQSPRSSCANGVSLTQ